MQKNEITEKEVKATPPKIQEDINLAAPGKLRVIKRNGKVVAFENEKIQVAVTKAFLANEGGNAAASERIHEKVEVIHLRLWISFPGECLLVELCTLKKYKTRLNSN